MTGAHFVQPGRTKEMLQVLAAATVTGVITCPAWRTLFPGAWGAIAHGILSFMSMTIFVYFHWGRVSNYANVSKFALFVSALLHFFPQMWFAEWVGAKGTEKAMLNWLPWVFAMALHTMSFFREEIGIVVKNTATQSTPGNLSHFMSLLIVVCYFIYRLNKHCLIHLHIEDFKLFVINNLSYIERFLFSLS